MNFKKIMAAVAAMSLVACAAVVPASASAEGATVEITQIELTLDELKAMDYVVDITMTLSENAGFNAFAFGVGVDDRCQFELDDEDQELIMTIEGAKSEDGANFAWINGATTKTNTKKGMVIYGLNVTVPQDAQPGDVFAITYEEADREGKSQIWSDTNTKVDYVAAGSVDAVDGWIKIAGEATTTTEETTTTETTTTTTETETTTTTTETETESTTTTTVTETETTTTTTGTDTGTATSTTGTGSPATGTTDVLPIVGVAAAAAILGGVAIVAKKKED